MNKKYIIEKLDEVIHSGSIKEEDKTKLIEAKKEVERSTDVLEVLHILASCLVRIFGDGFDLFN